MKRFIKSLVIISLCILTFAVCASAALTEKQQNAVIDYAEKFI